MARTKQKLRNIHNNRMKEPPILPQAPEGFSMIEVVPHEHICHCNEKFKTRDHLGTHHNVEHNKKLAKCGICKISSSKYRLRGTLDASGNVIEDMDMIAYPNPSDCNLQSRQYFCPCQCTFASLQALRQHQEKQHRCILLYQDYLDIFKKGKRLNKRQRYAGSQQTQKPLQGNDVHLESEIQQKKRPERLNKAAETENCDTPSEVVGEEEPEDSSTVASEAEVKDIQAPFTEQKDDETRAFESKEFENKKSHRDLKRDHSHIDVGAETMAINSRQDSLLEDGDGGYCSDVENESPPKKKRKKTTSKKQRKQPTKDQNIPQEDYVLRANTTPATSSSTISHADADHQRSVSKGYKPTERERLIVMHARATAARSAIPTSTNQKKLKYKCTTGKKESRKECDTTQKSEVEVEEKDGDGDRSKQLEMDVDGDIVMGGVKKREGKSIGKDEFKAGEEDEDNEEDDLEEECVLLERKIAKKNKRIQKVEKAIAEEKAAYILKINELRGNIKQIAEIMSQQVSGDSDDELL